MLSIGKLTVNYLIDNFRYGYGLKYRSQSGKPRKITKRVDHNIKRKTVSDTREIAIMKMSQILVRRLHDLGLFERIAVKKFAKDYLNWATED